MDKEKTGIIDFITIDLPCQFSKAICFPWRTNLSREGNQVILYMKTTCFADGINLLPRAKQVDSTGKESGFPAPLEGCLGELALFLMWCEVFFTFFANLSSGGKKVSDKG